LSETTACRMGLRFLKPKPNPFVNSRFAFQGPQETSARERNGESPRPRGTVKTDFQAAEARSWMGKAAVPPQGKHGTACWERPGPRPGEARPAGM